MRKAFDHVVIGGGSGGLSCANRLAELGRRVALFDFVTPSETRGTQWGFGGTCVNVGCIPKKLFHDAGELALESREKAKAFGLSPFSTNHDWNALRQTVQNHVKSLSFQYSKVHPNVTLIRAQAKLRADKTVEYEEQDFFGDSGVETKSIEAKHSVVLACGGRPSLPPDVKGASEFGITSDDIFSLKESPGKILCVGGSYVGLEVAGFLSSLGYETHLAVRSRVLKGDGFDSDCADKVLQLLQYRAGCIVHLKTVPRSITAVGSKHKYRVELVSDGKILHQEFDTVFFGTGRHVDFSFANGLDIEKTKGGKIQVDPISYETSVSGVFAIGDMANTGMPELTPVAVMQGELLAERLSNFQPTKISFGGLGVPSAVFTPTEYARVGYSELAAQNQFGVDNVETYLMDWKTLDSAATATGHHECFAKLVCLKSDETVVGVHFVGPRAGELMQGYSLAVNKGITKQDFKRYCLGIHPTNSEALIDLRISRSSGEDFVQTGGCAGGRCG